ncbi:MAG: hypothetical protein ACFFAU_03805 [Candidatus Hodarchaeota archaeon]
MVNWGEVRVYVTSDAIKSDNWTDLYYVDFKTYFDGNITNWIYN